MNAVSAITSLRKQLQPKEIFLSLAIGLVSGIETTTVNLALALMIFSGDLAAQLTIGITILFLGSCIHYLVAALGSSYKGLLSSVQDSPAVIMSVIIAAMIAGMPQASSETKFYTALASIMLASLIIGLVCLLLGKFKLGSLVSYVPFPVIGGFLAGTGVLLILGGLQVMTGKSITLFNLILLFQVDTLYQWLAGVCLAVILFVLVQKVNHYLVLPGTLATATVIFFIILAASKTSISQAVEAGWLIHGLPSGGVIFRFWNPAGFALVDWKALFGQIGSLLACVVVSLISVLLNTTALELSTEQEIDLNIELKTTGWANLIAGVAGGSIGFPILGDTVLAYRLGARARLNGIFAAGVMAFVLAAGSGFLEYFPNFVLGGMLCFIGIDFMFTWLYTTWFSMPRLDYGIVVFIALLINIWGFLQGVGIGLALAVFLFVFQYSRTRAVRLSMTGASYQSSVDRTHLSSYLLRHHGDWLYILELQGFIFFGTANQVLAEIRSHLERSECLNPPRFIILDFRLVSGLDSSAAFSFAKIKRLVQKREITLVLTHTTPSIQKQLNKDLPLELFHYFPDLDHGIEWCENKMIASFEDVGLHVHSNSLYQQLTTAFANPEQEAILKQYLKPLQVQAGERIISQGSQQCGLYMIEGGKVVIQLECDDGSILRLRTLEAGAFFGEMGLYSGEPASADVIAEQPTSLQVLMVEDLAKLEQAAPNIAATLHRFVAAYMSERLAKITATVQALR